MLHQADSQPMKRQFSPAYTASAPSSSSMRSSWLYFASRSLLLTCAVQQLYELCHPNNTDKTAHVMH